MFNGYRFTDPKGNESFSIGSKNNSDNKETPVIFIHGLINSVYYVDEDYLKYFEKLGPSYSIPLPGHYPSIYKSPLQTLSFDTVVDMVIQNINDLIGSEREYILIGHSTGALVAMAIALRSSNKVKGLISIGGMPTGLESCDSGSMGLFQKMSIYKLGFITKSILSLNTCCKFAHKIGMAEVFANKANYDFSKYEEYYLPAMKSLDGSIVVRYFQFLAGIDLTEQLKDIKCACLFIVGEGDPYISVDKNKEMANKVNRGQLAVISDCGHWPMYEQPLKFKSIFETWTTEYIND